MTAHYLLLFSSQPAFLYLQGLPGPEGAFERRLIRKHANRSNNGIIDQTKKLGPAILR
jgi:hypothetical protein